VSTGPVPKQTTRRRPAGAFLLICALLVFLGTRCSRGISPSGGGRAGFALNYDLILGPLNGPTPADLDAIQDTIRLIQNGEHTLALNRLSSLSERYPENSALRILLSYVLLETGNLVGAFEQAEEAHEMNGENPYKCWYLAKVALMTGHMGLCHRELAHLRKAQEMEEEVSELEAELKRE